MNLSAQDVAALLPSLIPAIAGCVLPIAALDRDQATQKWIRGAMFLIALVALGGTFLYTTSLWSTGSQPTFGPLKMDRLAQFNAIYVSVAAAMAVLQLWDHLHQEGWVKGESLAMLMFSVTGMILLAATTHLLLLFLALELLSIPLYVLTAIVRMRASAVEGGMKYFLTGAVASSCILMGSVLLYGLTGSLDLAVIGPRLLEGGLAADPLTLVAVVLLMAGFLFKIGAVPFHQWVPDVYEAAPHPISGFMAAATKGAALLVLLRIFPWNLGSEGVLQVKSQMAFAVLAVLTMVVGNLLALAQTNVKRLLAYSSISQAGYLLLAFVAGTPEAFAGMVYYLAGYLAVSLGTFGLFTALGLVGDRTDLLHLRGQGWRRPELGIAMAICLFSMAGIPPTAGFFGKYQIFKELVAQGHIALAVVGVLASLVSVAYYFRVVAALFLDAPSEGQVREAEERPPVVAALAGGTVLVSALLVMLLGLFPGAAYHSLARRAVVEAQNSGK